MRRDNISLYIYIQNQKVKLIIPNKKQLPSSPSTLLDPWNVSSFSLYMFLSKKLYLYIHRILLLICIVFFMQDPLSKDLWHLIMVLTLKMGRFRNTILKLTSFYWNKQTGCLPKTGVVPKHISFARLLS